MLLTLYVDHIVPLMHKYNEQYTLVPYNEKAVRKP